VELAGTGRWTAGSSVRGVGASEGVAPPAPAGARERPAGRTAVGSAEARVVDVCGSTNFTAADREEAPAVLQCAR
jgi:hypothetical protein